MLENVKDALDRGISAVSVKSEAMVESSKVRAQLQNLERERTGLITRLGAAMYQMWQTNSFSRESFQALCQSIHGCEEEMSACSRRLDEIRLAQERQLAAVQAQQAQQAAPPPQDTPVEADQFWAQAPAAQGRVCPCGNLNPEGARFCTRCGKPLDN